MSDNQEKPQQLGLEFSFSNGKTLLVYGNNYDLSSESNQRTILANFARNSYPILTGLDEKPVMVNMSQVTVVRVVVVK